MNNMTTTNKNIMVGACCGGHISSAAKDMLQMGGNSLQFYLSDRLSFEPGKPLPKEEIDEILRLRKEENLYVVVHGKLILNFCQDDMKNVPALTCDLIEAAKINADVVIHQGKNTGISREEAISRFVMNVIEAIDQTPHPTNKFLLENSCRQGTELGYDLNDLVNIWMLFGCTEVNPVHNEEDEDLDERADDDDDEPKWPKHKLKNYRERIGFCLDLCHAYVGGMINMRDPNAVHKFMQEFDKRIGFRNLKLIHSNDSEIKFDGRNDSHQDLLMGFIGGLDLGGNSLGFQKVVEYAVKYGIPMILETPGNIPIPMQIYLLNSWATFIASQNLAEPEIEEIYLEMTQEIRDQFTRIPVS